MNGADLIKRWLLYIAAGLLLAGAIGGLVSYFWPTQQEQVASIRNQSNQFLVITRDMFVADLAPWKERREKQGFEVTIGSWQSSPTAGDIQHWIQQAFKKAGGRCRYIMLVGDCDGDGNSQAPWHLPAFFGDMGYKYEEDEPAKPIVSDALYGDIDNDGQVEVAVGRLPVHNIAQLKLQIGKIVQFEEREPTPDFYRAVLWTGAKHHHYAMLNITLQFIRNRLPDWLYPYLISSHPESACSGPLDQQPEQFLSVISQPAFISMVVGHGDYNNLRCAEQNDEEIKLKVEAIEDGLPSLSAVGPLLLLTCDAGSYYLPAEKGPSMAEAFVLHPGGPVAVVASAGFVNVVTNFYLAGSLAKHLNGNSGSIGDLLVDSRQILFDVGKYTLKQIYEHDTRTHALLNAPQGNNMEMFTRKNLIREEGLLYNLMGDPSLAFNKPLPMQVRAEDKGAGRIRLSGTAPQDADRMLIQHYDLNRLMARSPMDATDEQRRQLFQAANFPPDRLFEQSLDGSPWHAELVLSDLQSEYGHRIRVMAFGKKESYYRTFSLPIISDAETKRLNKK